MKAPIIVLEGLDACGKSTQTDLLLSQLESKGISASYKRFPGYTQTAAGQRIAAYLRGEFGPLQDLDPRIISALYASDRLAQVEEIEKMRDEFDVIIFDRGVTSNLIYTPARGKNPEDTAQLIEYVRTLEYKIFGFPKESLVIYLHATPNARKKIHKAKNRPEDLHEIDEDYLKKVETIALEYCEKDFLWQKIDVDHHGELRKKEDIAQQILTLVLEKLQRNKPC